MITNLARLKKAKAQKKPALVHKFMMTLTIIKTSWKAHHTNFRKHLGHVKKLVAWAHGGHAKLANSKLKAALHKNAVKTKAIVKKAKAMTKKVTKQSKKLKKILKAKKHMTRKLKAKVHREHKKAAKKTHKVVKMKKKHIKKVKKAIAKKIKKIAVLRKAVKA